MTFAVKKFWPSRASMRSERESVYGIPSKTTRNGGSLSDKGLCGHRLSGMTPSHM